MRYLFTSESVSEGHPDKLCDKISDSILDECLRIDRNARVAVETMVKGMDDRSYIVIGGEVTVSSKKKIDYEQIAREAAAEIDILTTQLGWMQQIQTSVKSSLISQQSSDIAQGVDEGKGYT